MSRPTWNQYFIDIAEVVATRSPCSRLHVGAVIVNPRNHIVGTGYNGPPAGEPHCDHSCDCNPRWQAPDNPDWSPFLIPPRCSEECNSKKPCTLSDHAEENAIYHSTTDILDYSTIYCTHLPCMKCATEIVWHDIKTVIYKTPYRDLSSLDYLKENGVKVLDFKQLV